MNTETIYTLLSGFNEIVVKILNNYFLSSSLKHFVYRDFKCLIEKFSKENHDIHAPIKKKLLTLNHVPYIQKVLKEAIIKQSQLEIAYIKIKTIENLKLYIYIYIYTYV